MKGKRALGSLGPAGGLLLLLCASLALAAAPALIRIDTGEFKGTEVLFKHELHVQRAGGKCTACHPPLVQKIGDRANRPEQAHPVCKACHRPNNPSGARPGCLDCHTPGAKAAPQAPAPKRP